MSMLEYKGYHATMEYDADSDMLYGHVYGINDSLNFEGKSLDEFKEMFHQSVDNYLEMCAFYGDKPDKEYKGEFRLRISPEQHRKAAIAAAAKSVSLNQYVSSALERSLAADGL